MHINKNVKGDGHTKYLSSKFSNRYYVIYSLKDAMSLQVVKYIYCVFSCSLKVFGDPEIKSIFELQESFVQLISNVGRYTLCRELFKALNELLVPCMCISGIVCYMKIDIDNLEQNTEICHHNTCH